MRGKIGYGFQGSFVSAEVTFPVGILLVASFSRFRFFFFFFFLGGGGWGISIIKEEIY